MTSRVFLHVGLPKSGTSYLQRVLGANKAALRDSSGLLFPGTRWRDQVAAVRDVRNLRGAKKAAGSWQRLADEITGWHGDAVVSMEWLAPASREEAERIVGDLPTHQVEVVFTARDLARTIPAAWQEFVQNGQTWPWERFVAAVTGADRGDSPPARTFWRQQDLPRLVEQWAEVVPRDRLHVVTVPRSGAPRDLLWERFAGVLGVDPAVATTEGHRANESLGMESTELMRRLNVLVRARELDHATVDAVFKHQLAKQILAGRQEEESRLTIPGKHHPQISRLGSAQIEAVGASGARVVGDLSELEPVLPPGGGRQPRDVEEAELLEIAMSALIDLSLLGRTDSQATS